MSELYSEKLIEHFQNPKNAGEIKDADVRVTVGNPVCGDVMTFTMKVRREKDKEIIEDIKFKTFGCAAAIASSDILAELAKGKTIEEAKMLSYKDIVRELGGLPPVKVHCTQMAVEGLKKLIEEYERKKKRNHY